MSALPNTLLIGAAKAGTTSLCDDLNRHPSIYLFPSKETHFFSYYYDRGIDYYRSLFHPSGEKIVMEASPEYTTGGRSQVSALRISEHLAGVKLIYMVRHPLRRLQSEYVQELANGKAAIPFRDAIFDWNLLEGSLYEKNYQIFSNAFSPDRVHVLFFEDYVTDKASTISALLDFMGADPVHEVFADRQAKNTREDKVIDPRFLKLIHHNRTFQRFRHLLPGNAKRWLRGLTSKKVVADANWDDALLAKIMPELRQDADQFLKRFGKPADYWFSADIV